MHDVDDYCCRMPEIIINVSALPSVHDTSCCEHACCDIENCKERFDRIWRLYRGWFISILLVVIVCAIIVVVLVLNNNNKTYPCLTYANDTPASSVSVSCLQYTWDQYCSTTRPYSFPSDYNGWWRRITQGGFMVRCSNATDCGVGSYANILVYMQYCNANYGGIP